MSIHPDFNENPIKRKDAKPQSRKDCQIDDETLLHLKQSFACR
jgi:hypothetical protein